MAGGRPTIMTEETLHKLEEVFAIGGTDNEACFYADISPRTLYKYQEEYPEFIQRKEALKEKPILKARQTVVRSLDDPVMAFKFLEKKLKEEFGNSVALQVEVGESDRKDLKEIINILKNEKGNSTQNSPELLQG